MEKRTTNHWPARVPTSLMMRKTDFAVWLEMVPSARRSKSPPSLSAGKNLQEENASPRVGTPRPAALGLLSFGPGKSPVKLSAWPGRSSPLPLGTRQESSGKQLSPRNPARAMTTTRVTTIGNNHGSRPKHSTSCASATSWWPCTRSHPFDGDATTQSRSQTAYG